MTGVKDLGQNLLTADPLKAEIGGVQVKLPLGAGVPSVICVNTITFLGSFQPKETRNANGVHDVNSVVY